MKKTLQRNKHNKSFVLLNLLFIMSFSFVNAQTYVTMYVEDFESIDVGTQIRDLDFKWWGFNSIITESAGNGANSSNRFITTTNTLNTVGISKVFSLINTKQYRFTTTVKTASTNTHNPLRITRPNGAGSYFNNGQIPGTNQWETYTSTFTALASEDVDFVTIKVNAGELSYDNIKLQIEGIAWTGAISTNWHDAGNWEGNQIPTQDDSVLVTNTTNQPIIGDAEVRVKNLEIADGARLLVQNSKPLIVNGQLTGNTGYVELLAGSTLFSDSIVGDSHIIPELGTFNVNAVFQSNMILQRQQPIPIYGEASDGLSVSVTLDGETKTTTASNGKWEVIFDAKEAGIGSLNLSITGTDRYNFTDILMGDVWICGGQSNMQLNVGYFKDSGYSEFTNVPGSYENNQIRFAKARIYESNEKQDNIQYSSNWEAANETSILQFSATSYFFGKYLHEEVNVPIGLILAARGGTGMGSFIPLETVNANANIKDKYDYNAINLSGPSTLYNTMIHPLTKQAVKGVIWYQGENEANRLADRTTLSSIFTDLISSWRTAWNQNDMPFLFTQLSAWAKQNNSPVESNIAIVRNQQLQTWKNVSNTGMVVSIDGGVNGGSDDIHPPNKEDVGSRLALFARKLVYGENIVYTGPKIRAAVRVNQTDKAILKFKHFGEGLEAKAVTLNTNGSEQFNLKVDSLYSFELAGEDNIFHEAVAKIENDSIITVTSVNVSEPAKVRFGWNNFPLTNLYNEADLPASPFEEQVTLVDNDNSISTTELVTYNAIPGRSPSDHYTCRVKLANEDDTKWRNAFVLQTRAKEPSEDPEEAYYDVLSGFTASWIAFESDFNGDDVIVEIAKKDGSPITKAMVRPVGEASAAVISNGKAYVTFTEAANVNVDINGQMEDNYTGHGYTGPKVHTISLFANPVFEKPNVNDNNVRVVQPSEDINTIDRETWQTIVFAPGVHDIGLGFQILTDETLYIPGDAVVHGTIHPPNLWGNQAAKNFKVYGSGTLSSENIVRRPDDDDNLLTKPFTYQAEGTHLEGFVVADPAFHTFNMGNSRGEGAEINIYKNLKILAWRVNSDGINAFRSSEVFDCFFRVQDDAFYHGTGNVNQHDNTVWNDANGAVLFLPNVVDGSTSNFSDVKVIYHRAGWHWWNGGRIINMRETAPGRTISNVHVKNILVEDPLPAFPPFYGKIDSGSNENIVFENIVFENIRQEHNGVTSILDANRGKPRNTLLGLDENRKFENIYFKNCYFNGKILSSFEDGDFLINEFVDQNTVVFSEGFQDNLINVTAPKNVSPNETINVGVEYSAAQRRDLQVYIQLNSSPWTNYGSTRITVEEGLSTNNISLTINENIPLANGAYKIVAILIPEGEGWPERLDEITVPNINAVSTLSTNEYKDIGVTIFPNPATNHLKIESAAPISNLKLYSIRGKLLFNKVLNQTNQYQLNLSNYSKGMYFIEVENSKGKLHSKLIIN
ncbi:sialate O-acetylesterase [Polaribacter sp.]|uniref:sialate O-acetylesterase n=1 Tax=Polaribacter sp. TaxID=1920175 RepID=UPI003F6D8962